MNAEAFLSYAQNGEDVVLHRALGHVEGGHYIEVGANDPTLHSISMAFYQRGWSGITIEPVHEFVERHRAERPRDIQVEAAISDASVDSVTLHQISGTGLSTLVDPVGDVHRESGWTVSDVQVKVRRLDDVLSLAGWDDVAIHFMVIDTEGAERDVLRTIDLHRWRPWVLVIEATEPLTTAPSYHSWEPLVVDAGYRFCLFDGLSRFYVCDERYDELHAALSFPACVHDVFDTPQLVELRDTIEALRSQTGALTEDVARLRVLADERDSLSAELIRARDQESQALASAFRWRKKAVETWTSSSTASNSDLEELALLRERLHAQSTELHRVRTTISWRVTGPLRTVRRLFPKAPTG